MALQSRGITAGAPDVTIRYEGMEVGARAGTSVAAALTEAGIAAYRHASEGDRGLFCGMGVCGECTISVDGESDGLACMTTVRDGMRLKRAAVTPAVAVDNWAAAAEDEALLTPELLVVGGGPAGLAAAAIAAEAGVQVALVDERGGLGGQYYKQPSPSVDLDLARLDAQYTAGRALIARVKAAEVEMYSGVRIWGADGPGELYAARGRQRWTIRPRRLVLATGAYERAVPFPGWTLPGVMTTGAGQSLLRAYQVAPGSRLLIAGNGPLNVQLAAELVRAGGSVVALIELAAMTSLRHAPDVVRMAMQGPRLMRDGLGYLATLRRARVPILTQRTVTQVEGNGRVERAIVSRLDTAGRPIRGSEQHFDVDAVCLGFGFMPGNELARMLGVRHDVDRRTGGYVVEHSASGRTDLPGVWVVGDAAEVGGAKVAEATGRLAGADVAASLGRTAPSLRIARRRRARQERFQQALWRVYRGPALFGQLADSDTVVCRCESVTLATIDSHLGGVRSAGALKRVTRVGMGRCQGRFCGFVVADRVAAATGNPVDGRSGFAPQPPLRPTPLSVLASDDTELNLRPPAG